MFVVECTISVVTTYYSCTTSTRECFAVFACCSTLTDTIIISQCIDALSSITWIQQTLILVQLTLQTIDSRRTGTFETSDGVGTFIITTKVSIIAFVDVLVTVDTMPPCKGTSAWVKYRYAYRHSNFKLSLYSYKPILQYLWPFTTHFFWLFGQKSVQLDP